MQMVLQMQLTEEEDKVLCGTCSIKNYMKVGYSGNVLSHNQMNSQNQEYPYAYYN